MDEDLIVTINRLIAERDTARSALKWYANKDNYIQREVDRNESMAIFRSAVEQDNGSRARDVINSI